MSTQEELDEIRKADEELRPNWKRAKRTFKRGMWSAVRWWLIAFAVIALYLIATGQW